MARRRVLDSPLPMHVGTKRRSAMSGWWRWVDRISVRHVRWRASRRGAAILFVRLLGFATPMLYSTNGQYLRGVHRLFDADPNP
jgi:hypothetical protein